jgi:hypothetical protein
MDHADAIALTRELAAPFAARADEADRQGKLPTEDVKPLKNRAIWSLRFPANTVAPTYLFAPA